MTTNLANPYVLMIEDDPDDQYLTRSNFKDHGYDMELKFMADGNNLIPFLQSCKQDHLPSLIIVDKNLPTADGLELLRQVKSSAEFKYIPVIVVSGTMMPDDIDECYANGANSIFQKPETDKATTDRIHAFATYWFNVVELPRKKTQAQISESY